MSAITSPREYFEQIIVPDFQDYINNQGDLRAAFHICISLHQLTDWIALSKGQDQKQIYLAAVANNKNVEHIKQLATNAKHWQPDHPHSKEMEIKSGQQALTLSQWEKIDDVQNWDKHGAGIQIKGIYKDDGQEIHLINVISNVYAFWKKEYDASVW